MPVWPWGEKKRGCFWKMTPVKSRPLISRLVCLGWLPGGAQTWTPFQATLCKRTCWGCGSKQTITFKKGFLNTQLWLKESLLPSRFIHVHLLPALALPAQSQARNGRRPLPPSGPLHRCSPSTNFINEDGPLDVSISPLHRRIHLSIPLTAN